MRPIEPEPAGTSALGLRASQAALARAGVSPADVDLIVFATMLPDAVFPGAGCFLQRSLGCGTIGALDVRGQCAGFVYALAVADRFVRIGQYRRVLAVASELHSVWVDYSPGGMKLARRFGDAAGAMLLGPGDNGSRVLATAMHADGSQHKGYWCEHPASRQHPVRITMENLRAGQHYPTMDEDAMSRFGAAVLPEVVREVIGRAGIDTAGVDRFIFGFVLPDIVETAARSLGVGADRVANPAAKYGHLGSAALPLSLSEDMEQGRVGKGSVVCLAAAGAGLAWGAALVEL